MKARAMWRLPKSVQPYDGAATMLCLLPGVHDTGCDDAHWPQHGGGIWRVSVDSYGVAYTWWSPA